MQWNDRMYQKYEEIFTTNSLILEDHEVHGAFNYITTKGDSDHYSYYDTPLICFKKGTFLGNENIFGWRQFSDCGTLHRLDGPAIVWRNGTHEYWVDGKKCANPITVVDYNGKNFTHQNPVRSEYEFEVWKGKHLSKIDTDF